MQRTTRIAPVVSASASLLSASLLSASLLSAVVFAGTAHAQGTAPVEAAPPAAAPAAAPAEPAPTTPTATTSTVPAEPAPTTTSTPPEQVEEAPKIDLAVPPKPGPAVQRTYHVHRGFYLAGDFGMGYMNATFTAGGGPSVGAEGLNMNGSVLVGGQASTGLAIGGGAIFDVSPAAEFDQSGTGVGNANIYNVMVGPFIDSYPQANGGWRMGGSIGFSTVGTSLGSGATAFGPGFAAWFGYTPWVSDNLSIGLSARFVGTVGFGDDEGSTRSINLVASIVYF